jgi:hypothetical protein
MRSRWGEATAVAWLLARAAPAAAQHATEIGLEALGTSSDPVVVVAGGYAALRPSDRGRIAALLGLGVAERAFAWRGEAVGHFLLNPGQQLGWGVYFAGGLAVVGDPATHGYLVLGLGLEGRPGGREGWVGERGVGGGVRVALGYRWRRFRSGSVP